MYFWLTVLCTYNYLAVFPFLVCQNGNRFARICHQTCRLVESFVQVELESVLLVSSEISHQHFWKITRNKDLDVIC